MRDELLFTGKRFDIATLGRKMDGADFSYEPQRYVPTVPSHAFFIVDRLCCSTDTLAFLYCIWAMHHVIVPGQTHV